jgi:hypothetical protein
MRLDLLDYIQAAAVRVFAYAQGLGLAATIDLRLDGFCGAADYPHREDSFLIARAASVVRAARDEFENHDI